MSFTLSDFTDGGMLQEGADSHRMRRTQTSVLLLVPSNSTRNLPDGMQ